MCEKRREYEDCHSYEMSLLWNLYLVCHSYEMSLLWNLYLVCHSFVMSHLWSVTRLNRTSKYILHIRLKMESILLFFHHWVCLTCLYVLYQKRIKKAQQFSWNLFDLQKLNLNIDKWLLCFDLTHRKKGPPRNVDDGRAAGDSDGSGRYGDGGYGLRMIPRLSPRYNQGVLY